MRWRAVGHPPKWAPVAVSSSSPPPGARQGLIRLRLAVRGAGSVRSQHLAVLGACRLYVSLLSFFPAFLSPLPFSRFSPGVQGSLQPPNIHEIPGHPWCPPASSAAGARGEGRRSVKLPSIFLTTLHPSPHGPGWQSRSHPPRPSQGMEETLENPVLPQSQQTSFFGSLWCRARGQCRSHRTVPTPWGMPRARAEHRARCCGAGHGAASGPLPHTQRPQPKAEGERLRVK